jgi:hypothetical protein
MGRPENVVLRAATALAAWRRAVDLPRKDLLTQPMTP